MLAGMLIVWGALLALTIWGVSRLFPRCCPARSDGDCAYPAGPLQILAHRLGCGELTREEYELMRSDIEVTERLSCLMDSRDPEDRSSNAQW